MRRFLGLLVVAAVIALALISSASSGYVATERASTLVKIPRVVGLRMDRATALLHSKRLRVNEECTGLFGCIIKRNWWICAQAPHAGKRVPRYTVVTIFGARRGEC